VIPKKIRDEMNLFAGSELEIETVGGEIRIRVTVSRRRLVERDGFLIFDGEGKTDNDIAEFINKEGDKAALREECGAE
jgi:AbrB family looped-hinge helix DNA binding protein